jgi:hypothetical protein
MEPATPHTAPWLQDERWARRKLVHRAAVSRARRALLALGYVAGALIGAGIVAAIIGWYRDPQSSPVELIGLGVLAAMLIGGLARLTRLWLRDRRYGATVCKLITLPGVIGGWFEADVECSLPPGAGPVTVRLENAQVPPSVPGAAPTVLWQTEQSAMTVAHETRARRSIIRVRLEVPHHPDQKPLPMDAPGHRFVEPYWALQLEKTTGGDDFTAVFRVPIYDDSVLRS